MTEPAGKGPGRGAAWTLARALPWASRPLTLCLSLLVLAAGVAFATFLLAAGRLVGTVPAALRGGFGSPAGRRMLGALALVASAFALQQVLMPFVVGTAEALGRRLQGRLREEVMAAALAPVGIGHLEDPEVLDRIRRSRGTSAGQFTPAAGVLGLATNAVTRLQVLAAGALVGTFRWWLGLALVAGGLVVRLRLWREGDKRLKVLLGQSRALRHADYYRDLAIRPAAAKELRLFGLSDWVAGRFRGHWLRAMTRLWDERDRAARVTLPWYLPAVVPTFATLALAGWAAVRGELGLTGLAVVAQAAITAGNVYLTDNDLMVEYGAAAVRPALGVRELVEPAPAVRPGPPRPAVAVRPAPGALPPDLEGAPRREIRFEEVRFAYPGTAAPVLDGLDLVIPAGRSLALVGANGAGKTTLVKLLTRLYDPVAGRLLVDGVDVRELDVAAWRRRLAVIFQDFVRYELPARENVGFGAVGRMHDRAALERAADRVGALPTIERLPRGWETPLSPQYVGGVEPSGGQWQRVALARALFAVQAGASVLALDEPTAGLDVRAEADLFDRFLELTRGLTTILVSHRFGTVRLADRIVVLEGGQVTEQGTHDQLVAMGGRYADSFRLQASQFAMGREREAAERARAGGAERA